MKKLNKKGQLGGSIEIGEEVLNFILFSMVITVILFISLTVYGAVNGTALITTPEAQGIFDMLNDLPELFDWGLLFLFGGVALASLVYFSLREFTPIEYIISWVFTVVFSFVIFIFGYIAQQFIEQTAFDDVRNQMIFLPFFVDNSFLFATIYFIIALIAMHTIKT